MRVLIRWRGKLHAPSPGSDPVPELVDLAIDRDGTLRSIRVRRSSGVAAWDLALAEAVQGVHFSEPPEEILSADGLAHLDELSFGASVDDDGRVVADWAD